MSSRLREFLLCGATLVGLGMSALLVAEYRHPSAALCGVGGGCEAARHSQYSEILGVPLPIIGVVFFGAVLLMAIAPLLRRWLWPLSAAGAVAGLVYIGIQAFLLNTYCPFCLVVDVAAVIIGVLAFGLRETAPRPATLAAAAVYPVLALVAVTGPLVWHAHFAVPTGATGGAVPAVVQREQKVNQVTVVEFVDFECPACRMQYAQFEVVLEKYRNQVDVVLKHMPLPQHTNAIDAARAFCCAEEGGAAREMAARLFRAERLRREDCEEIAVSLGLDRDEFRRCVDSDRVAQRLRADQSDADTAGIRGLPTFWIGEERFEGVHESEVLRTSIERALRRGLRPAPS